jgi:hypothetical protein
MREGFFASRFAGELSDHSGGFSTGAELRSVGLRELFERNATGAV